MTQSQVRPFPEESSLFLDRDLSLVEFQRRVFEEACDENNPLLERVKFLSILGLNVEQFVMTRGAELQRSNSDNLVRLQDHGSEAGGSQGQRVQEAFVALVNEAREYFRARLIPELNAVGIHVLKYDELSASERGEANAYFRDSILPVLTPLAFDPTRPFPHVVNLGLNLAILVRDNQGNERFAYIRVPETLPQLFPLHVKRRKASYSQASTPGLEQGFVWLEAAILENLDSLFPGFEVLEANRFQVIRDADISAESYDASELLDGIEEEVRQRNFAPIVALVVSERMSERLLEILARNLQLNPVDAIRTSTLLPLSRLIELARLDRPELRDPPFAARIPAELARCEKEDIFSRISQGDILLHHPFESFEPVIEFLRQAARDPDVLAIKISLYRVGKDSPLVEALIEAARHGKEVSVVVELKARFDEESNVGWARALHEAGAHVVYGMVGLKVHAKAALVVRREGSRIRRYVHLSTGNYNPATSRIYTDLALFTCREEIGEDATDLFNFLTGYSAANTFRKLIVAPVGLRERLGHLIDREIECARSGKAGHLIFKVNALVDREVIRHLYRASVEGVRVDLLVRGACCLRPGVPGVSDNIRVRSIVGRFLEHSRIYYFANGGSAEIYIGSADVMPRNLDRRVEVLVPIEEAKLAVRLRDEILKAYLADNVKARELKSDGTYARVQKAATEIVVSSQEWLLNPQPVHPGPRAEERTARNHG